MEECVSQPILFYFDFASPYGYLAATRVEALGQRFGRAVVWRPILLGAVFKVTGSMPNLNRPLQGDYLRHDVPRFARLLGVPLADPLPGPFASLAAARAFYWLEATAPDQAKALAAAIYRAHWTDGRSMEPADAVADVAADLGIDRDGLLTAIQDPAVKDRVRQETQAAVDAGVFGSPFLFVDGEPFWGVDRLDHAARWLETGGW